MREVGEPGAVGAVYRAFWRWHFYAGLAVLPVLMLLALTGGIYLFQPEIDAALDRPMARVEARPAATPPSRWQAAAEQAVGGEMVRLIPPGAPGEAARVAVAPAGGGPAQLVFIDPADARVTGLRPEVGAMGIVKRLHSLELAGPVGNLLVEVVAGWAIMLALTGVVLWWPRGGSPAIALRGTPRRRLFWRDLHASIGIFAAAVIVFLALTGMPWALVWGEQARRVVDHFGLGRPAPREATAWRTSPTPHHGDMPGLPWTLQQAGLDAGAGPADVDLAMALADAAGLPRPYTLIPPFQPGGAWTASRMDGRVEDTRALYLDPAAGRVVDDIGYARFGPGSKAIEWGVSVHQGRQYGLANRLVMLFGCMAVWVLAISGLVMWWSRRPQRRLAAPPRTPDRRAAIALACLIGPMALLFPPFGASLAVVLIIDLTIRALRKRLRSKESLP